MSILSELSESKMYPTESKLDRAKHDELVEAAHVIFMALNILLSEDKTENWAEKYVKKTLRGDFRTWRSDATDLYAILYALHTGNYHEGKYRTFPLGSIRRWLNHVQDIKDAEDSITRVFFFRLDGLLGIRDGSLKSLRRIIMDWRSLDNRERRSVFTRLLHLMRRRFPRAEVLVQLESLARTKDYEIDETAGKKIELLASLSENATAGGTSAASVATVSQPLGGQSLGAGFDSNGHKGIYQGAKPIVLRRGEPPKKEKK